jgi:hypothetical protein
MTLQLLASEFPYTVYEENFLFFFISVLYEHFPKDGGMLPPPPL